MAEEAQRKQLEMMKSMQAQNASQMQQPVQQTSAPNQGGGGLGLLCSSCCSSLCLVGCGVLLTMALSKQPPGK